MAVTIAMLEAMIDAGASPEVIVNTIKSARSSSAARRTKDAARQRKSRATRASHVTLRDIADATEPVVAAQATDTQALAPAASVARGTNDTGSAQKENPPYPLKKKHSQQKESFFELESEEGKKERLGDTRARENSEFEQWYAGYPHKVGKQAARKAFTGARRAASLDVLIAGRDRYMRTKPPDRDWCNPATWLNQGRWEDQPAEIQFHGGANGQHRNGGSAGLGFSGLSAHLRARSAARSL